ATAPLDRPVAEPRAPAGPHELIKPPRLRPGDIIGIVTPAGPVLHEIELDHARAQAHLLGLEPRFGAHITEQYGYLAGSDGHRAEDFNRFARDPDVRAIFALRGGYGTMRILGDIDYDALADDPKVVLGFSDLTALLNAITSRTGLVTFHGPVAGHSRLSAVLLDGIRRAVMSREPLGVMHAPRSASLAGGTARGRLTGGNLSVLCALVGTPYAVPHAGRLMILEDVHEAPYRVDRMLTQLRLSGELSRVAGIVLGRFDDCIPKADDLPSLTIAQTLRDRLADLGKPVLTGAQIGHLEDQWTLPLGVTAAVDATRGHLEIEESGVA
ncbi:MAG: muramoyltetrapeptide carboxypeptidase, partial [Candidatus Eremiobacteraeota bacterium]|nr:muramoyltetrapeptide carboxypeptidase [Candidatus Eremiobacteraeota bacterium]